MECILCASSIKIGNENRSRKRKKSFVVCLVGRSVGLFVCLLVCLFVCLLVCFLSTLCLSSEGNYLGIAVIAAVNWLVNS